MARLYLEEGLGRRNGDIDTFEIRTPKPSRRLKRSVALVNYHAADDAKDPHTYEDWPVTLCQSATGLGLALFVITPVSFTLRGLFGSWVLAWIMVLLLLVGASVALKIVMKENLIDFLASRIFGVPARPLLYIRRAWDQGKVRHRVNNRLVGHPHLSARE
ncbi:MAG: hypothetical protein K0S68_387 [Candidatus Saccharibacteria bacterium]|jgi:hypothetical protein|nr:hypothetical protein [Candidatus Saccharibacteria bacterium]